MTKTYKGFLVSAKVNFTTSTPEENCVKNFVPNDATLFLVGADVSVLNTGAFIRRKITTTDTEITMFKGDNTLDTIPLRVYGIT